MLYFEQVFLLITNKNPGAMFIKPLLNWLSCKDMCNNMPEIYHDKLGIQPYYL